MRPFALLFLLLAAAPPSPQRQLAAIFAGRDPAAVAIVEAHQKLAAEATKYLIPCDKVEDWRCPLDQYDFVLDYIRAFYGYANSEFSLAVILSGSGVLIPAHSYIQPGVRQDIFEGCAWSFVLAAADAQEPITPYVACAGLDDSAAAAALGRSKVIAAAIADNQARGDKPPDIFPAF